MSICQTKMKVDASAQSFLRGLEATEMLTVGTDMGLMIKTALGKSIRCTSAYVGSDLSKLIFLKVPDISPNDKHHFLNRGFWIKVLTICDKGEGARFSFQSKIFRFDGDLGLLAIEMPYTVSVSPLRAESRFQTDIVGVVSARDYQLPVKITDISKQGCAFSVAPINESAVKVNDEVKLKVVHDTTNEVFVFKGVIRNSSKSQLRLQAGVSFEQDSWPHAQSLMSKLRFNGSVLVFGN